MYARDRGAFANRNPAAHEVRDDEGSPMRFFFSGFLFGGQKEFRLLEANLWSEARGIAAVRFPLFPKSHAPPGSGKERLLTIFIILSPSDGSEKKSPYFVKIGPYTAAHPPYIGTELFGKMTFWKSKMPDRRSG